MHMGSGGFGTMHGSAWLVTITLINSRYRFLSSTMHGFFYPNLTVNDSRPQRSALALRFTSLSV